MASGGSPWAQLCCHERVQFGLGQSVGVVQHLTPGCARHKGLAGYRRTKGPVLKLQKVRPAVVPAGIKVEAGLGDSARIDLRVEDARFVPERAEGVRPAAR